MVSLLGKSWTNKQISVLGSFARPQADGKLKKPKMGLDLMNGLSTLPSNKL
jgi:hypothetical protein